MTSSLETAKIPAYIKPLIEKIERSGKWVYGPTLNAPRTMRGPVCFRSVDRVVDSELYLDWTVYGEKPEVHLKLVRTPWGKYSRGEYDVAYNVKNGKLGNPWYIVQKMTTEEVKSFNVGEHGKLL
ncbi:hypothetical protein EPN87_03970 [archaeon]|nr:MAG: hypothetical protein EPN87_03970 [archaeon]